MHVADIAKNRTSKRASYVVFGRSRLHRELSPSPFVTRQRQRVTARDVILLHLLLNNHQQDMSFFFGHNLLQSRNVNTVNQKSLRFTDFLASERRGHFSKGCGFFRRRFNLWTFFPITLGIYCELQVSGQS